MAPSVADPGALALVGLLEGVMPAGVAVAASTMPPGEAEPALVAGEEVAVARAVAKRRREYAFGRACARRALAQLGLHAAGAIRGGVGGAPQWPVGIVGSITHCELGAAAAVVRAPQLGGLGIDLETRARAGRIDLLALAATATERVRHAALATDLPVGALLFSAKESVYKCVYPRGGRVLEFADVELALAADGTFTVLGATGYDVTTLRGRVTLTPDLVVTAAYDPPSR